MEKKAMSNKAEGSAAANKSDDDIGSLPTTEQRAEMLEHAKKRFADATDVELAAAHTEGKAVMDALNAEANKRGIPLGLNISAPIRNVEAGKFEGRFIVRRPMSGDKEYLPGDPREGRVSELEHLITSGAISPADDETAEAFQAFSGATAAVYTPPAPVEEEGEGE